MVSGCSCLYSVWVLGSLVCSWCRVVVLSRVWVCVVLCGLLCVSRLCRLVLVVLNLWCVCSMWVCSSMVLGGVLVCVY